MKPNDIAGLRTAIENHLGRPLTVHTDFDELSTELKGAVSSSTLKRVWGYNKDHQNISLKSVNILSQYLGYENYDDFINSDYLVLEDHQKLYAASKIATLADRVHRDRFQYVYEQFNQCKYKDALQTLSAIDDEINVLIQSAKPYIDSTVSIISELCIKAQVIWSCHNQEEGVIEKICGIFEQAILLAKSINNHSSLWNIYELWSYWMFLSKEYERALELNELGIKQAQIILFEREDEEIENGTELVVSLNDRAFFLMELGEYEEAAKIVDEAMDYNCEVITQCYLLLNYAKANVELQLQQQSVQKVDYEKTYREIIRKIEDYHRESSPVNESIHLLFISHFNLGVYCQEFLNPQDNQLAADFFRKAIDIYNSRDIPDPRHQSYYKECIEQLQQIDGLPNETT
ncbi:MAG: hypothetical protein SNH27_06950 [Rikenellaceae bacterium]